MSAELDPRRWWMLPVILVGSFLSFLDFFIVNIALPAMHDDLGARPAQLQFVVAGYGIGFAVSLITGGRLGDIFGRKRVFLVGIGGFTLASALCGLAVNPTMLIASRVLQAMMAATLTPQVLAIIRVEFAPHERPFAIGLYGTSMGFASIVAQVLGGALVSINLFGWSWRSIFLINVPIGGLAICVAALVLRESRGADATHAGSGWCRPHIVRVVPADLSAGRGSRGRLADMVLRHACRDAAGAVRLRPARTIGGPSRPHATCRTPSVAVPTIAFGLIVSVVFFSGLAVFFVVLTVFFQAGLGYSAFAAGMMFLPFAIGFCCTSSLSGPITARIGGRIIGLGTALMALALLGVVALAHAGTGIDPRASGAAVPDLRSWPGPRSAGADQHRGRQRRRQRSRRGFGGRPVPDHGTIVDRPGRRGDRRRVLRAAG